MDDFVAELLDRICSVCGAISASLTIWTDTGQERVQVYSRSRRAKGSLRQLSSGQMSLFTRTDICEVVDGDLFEVSNTTAGESRSYEAIQRMSFDLQCGWVLQKSGKKNWRLSASRDLFDLDMQMEIDRATDGGVIQSLHPVFPLLELIRSVIPFSGQFGIMPGNQSERSTEEKFAEFDPPMFGSSEAIIKLIKRTRRIAGSSVPVLIEGENGTGKEIIARNLHNVGPRKDKPLVIVNCMEMPETMLQGELFGHVRGAFTGAMYDRRGLVEGAAGGTFFLDEIGELPLTLQAALLRVIQEKEIRRIGESERRTVETRFVFATNRDLASLVKDGRFREDYLYYRIRGVRLTIPPLRERRADIMVLAHRFLVTASRREGVAVPGISNGGVRHLVAHNWPGNVRELKNEMERVIALYPDVRMIEPHMLSSVLRDNWAETGSGPVRIDNETLPEAVIKLERKMIAGALERFDSNRTRSAEFLGITRQGLLKKLKRYRLEEKIPR